MKKETKDIIQLLIFMAPMMALVVFGWLYSPLYHQTKQEQREHAQEYMIETQYHHHPAILLTRQQLQDRYNFTDDEINSAKIMEKAIEYFKSNN